MKQEVTLIATAAMGIESVVGNEVRKLGYDPKIDNGKVTFKGPLSAIARSNLWLRAADGIKLYVGEFEVTTFNDLIILERITYEIRSHGYRVCLLNLVIKI